MLKTIFERILNFNFFEQGMSLQFTSLLFCLIPLSMGTLPIISLPMAFPISLQTNFLFFACAEPMVTYQNDVLRSWRLHHKSQMVREGQGHKNMVSRDTIWDKREEVQSTQYVSNTQRFCEHWHPIKRQ